MNETIANFMEPGAIAVVGATDTPRKFGGAIYRELKRRGYRVFAVNPGVKTVDGDRAYGSVKELPEEVAAAIVAVRPEKAGNVVREAQGTGIRRIWFQQGADFSEAEGMAQKMGIETVRGKCILMYAGKVGGIHKFHQVVAKLFGRY